MESYNELKFMRFTEIGGIPVKKSLFVLLHKINQSHHDKKTPKS